MGLEIPPPRVSQDRISGIGNEVGVDLPDLRAPTYKQGIVWDLQSMVTDLSLAFRITRCS